MSRRPFQLLMACGLLVLAAGCLNENGAGHRHPRYSHEVALDPAHPDIAISLELSAALRLALPGPDAGSNYAWEIVSNNARVLEQTTGLRTAPAVKGPDAARTTTVAFYSLLPGKSIVRFALVRPGEPDAVPAGHFEVVVVVREPDSE